MRTLAVIGALTLLCIIVMIVAVIAAAPQRKPVPHKVILEADCWSAVDSAYQTHLEHIYAIDGPGHLMTVRIPGHAGDYVLIIYPGQE